MDTPLQEGALNTDQQVVGQHTQKDVGSGPSLQMMKDGSLAQGAFHRAEGNLNPRRFSSSSMRFSCCGISWSTIAIAKL